MYFHTSVQQDVREYNISGESDADTDYSESEISVVACQVFPALIYGCI